MKKHGEPCGAFPFLEPREASEKVLVAMSQEASVGAVSTRLVDDRMNPFLDCPLIGGWSSLWLDPPYVGQRDRRENRLGRGGNRRRRKYRRQARDRRLRIGPSEAETFWSPFLKRLLCGGPRGVKLVVSHAREGLKAAIGRVMGASW